MQLTTTACDPQTNDYTKRWKRAGVKGPQNYSYKHQKIGTYFPDLKLLVKTQKSCSTILILHRLV